MALDKSNLDTTGSGSRGAGARGLYSTADAKATVKGANYFNLAAKELANTKAILIVASDATFEGKLSIAAGVVTLAALDTYT